MCLKSEASGQNAEKPDGGRERFGDGTGKITPKDEEEEAVISCSIQNILNRDCVLSFSSARTLIMKNHSQNTLSCSCFNAPRFVTAYIYLYLDDSAAMISSSRKKS